MTHPLPKVVLAALCLGALGQTDCGLLAVGALVSAAISCPELLDKNTDPLSVEFSPRADVNATVGAFVLAARDLLDVSVAADEEAKVACVQIGHDLGLTDADMTLEGAYVVTTKGACTATAKKIAAIVRGGLQLDLQVTPPRCSFDAAADANCSGRCNAGGQTASSECTSSCKAHGELHATCEMPRIIFGGSRDNPNAAQLVATLSANLPRLVRAELGLAQRALANVDTLVSVGARLRTIADKGGDKAVRCVVAATEITTLAAVSLGLTVDESASVTMSVGGKG